VPPGLPPRPAIGGGDRAGSSHRPQRGWQVPRGRGEVCTTSASRRGVGASWRRCARGVSVIERRAAGPRGDDLLLHPRDARRAGGAATPPRARRSGAGHGPLAGLALVEVMRAQPRGREPADLFARSSRLARARRRRRRPRGAGRRRRTPGVSGRDPAPRVRCRRVPAESSEGRGARRLVWSGGPRGRHAASPASHSASARRGLEPARVAASPSRYEQS